VIFVMRTFVADYRNIKVRCRWQSVVELVEVPCWRFETLYSIHSWQALTLPGLEARYSSKAPADDPTLIERVRAPDFLWAIAERRRRIVM
jgi:hypothetical protein